MPVPVAKVGEKRAGHRPRNTTRGDMDWKALGIESTKRGWEGADTRTESFLPFGDRIMCDIVGNSMYAPTRGRNSARAFKISCMSHDPMLCPTRSTRVIGPYATRSSSRNSMCAWIWAGSATLDDSG
jgi:hypothetical protein